MISWADVMGIRQLEPVSLSKPTKDRSCLCISLQDNFVQVTVFVDNKAALSGSSIANQRPHRGNGRIKHSLTLNLSTFKTSVTKSYFSRIQNN